MYYTPGLWLHYNGPGSAFRPQYLRRGSSSEKDYATAKSAITPNMYY